MHSPVEEIIPGSRGRGGGGGGGEVDTPCAASSGNGLRPSWWNIISSVKTAS